MLRGWAGILVLLITFSSLYLLIKRSIRRIQIFLLGYAIGGLAGIYLQPHDYFPWEPWKFGFGYPITLLVLLFILYASAKNFNNLKKSVFPLLVLGGLSIYLNARSLGAIIILTAIILWLRNRNLGKSILTRVSPQSILAGGLILGLTIWGLISIYSFAAQKGYLGEEARLKYAWQDSGRFGLLLGGRSEILASAIAIRDAPLIGHGSWAKDPAYRVLLYRLIDLGYERTQEEMGRYINQTDLIPAHSHIFQAWVWAGMLGAIFWIMILGFIIKVFIQSNRFPNNLYIFVIFFSIGAIWDIFFSPFGSIMRLRWAFQLIIFITAYCQSQQIEQQKISTHF
jgi:O-antigen ligase